MKYYLESYADLDNQGSVSFDWFKRWVRVKKYNNKRAAISGFKAARGKASSYLKYRLRAIHRIKPVFTPLDTWVAISKDIAIKYLATLEQTGYLHEYFVELYPEVAGKNSDDDAVFSLALRYKLV